HRLPRAPLLSGQARRLSQTSRERALEQPNHIPDARPLRPVRIPEDSLWPARRSAANLPIRAALRAQCPAPRDLRRHLRAPRPRSDLRLHPHDILRPTIRRQSPPQQHQSRIHQPRHGPAHGPPV
ncbi:hypothetical protein C0993_001599, partial [Termitomyces sp. T159_Od127]